MKHKFFKPEAYAAFAAAFLSNQISNGQVIINDYDPDLRLLNWTTDAPENDDLYIDIDNNGDYDLRFWVDDLSEINHTLHMEVNDMVTAAFAYSGGFGSIYADGFSQGQIIGPSLSDTGWQSEFLVVKHAIVNNYWQSSSFFCSYVHTGAISTQPYYPLRFNIDGNTHYGWVRLRAYDLLGYNHEDCSFGYGSPIDVFEIEYESNADTPIVADNGKSQDDIWAELTKNPEVITFADLGLWMYNYGATTPDFSELRIFLINDSTQALNFSLEDALALSAENYFVFTPPDFFYGDTLVQFNSSTKNINGNDLDPLGNYSGYYLKMPLDGSPLSLSAPFTVLNLVANTGISNNETIQEDISFIQIENGLQITIENFTGGNYQLYLYDIAGQKLIDTKLDQTQLIPVGNISTGIYIGMVLKNGTPIIAKKVFVR